MMSLRPLCTWMDVSPNLKQNYLSCHLTFVESVKALVDILKIDGVSE